MGFFNKLRKKVRGQIAPVMPRRGGFLGGMPQTKPLITDMRFRGRMPQKPIGLSGLFLRLQEQLRNQQMRIPQPIPELRAGDIMPNSPVLDRRPSPPRMPAPPIAVPPGIIPNLVKKQIQQPQMQSFGRPQLPFQGGFMPEMRAGGGGIDKAIYDLKFKLNG